ncbi:hypothetical protein Ae168Ps1_2152 [Pseudonocardia sp. Ae168_Ps1]|uniref:MarR family winged helix-turn-helix transcriptional regulator n=1 Tax=unclassified Pseudonocardia TaxID=2619320 RepID=UPI00094A9CCC|nr:MULTISPECIES: MarR family transcriptional regulator [unclassified Pseudonocardia]OLL73767.1 hypothetical protein Ae150APs1_2145 [Pseudonocardia sp. Ae150A_Ps1]OLL79746.1 hypothetical protein Ae168Ps1_2152 [Pseudonocardia sp. Ae168_Ps1]OLL86118.1 hypothetical protein Ae263Ps1_3173c [Pseudonocardia sp. Ae263_Ps1]OLL93851.1 hypothetical protein Ae356Ps1_3748 [Pseudonocardia sp. Ae356_Ps1]
MSRSTSTPPSAGDATDPTGRRAGEAVLLAAGRLTAMLDAACADEDLTPLQARYLRTLRDPLPQGELADRLGVDPARVSGLARDLGHRGLVERVPGGDRRQRLARLTPEGEDAVHRIGARLAARSPMNREFDRAERETLIALLDRIVSALPGPGA